MTKITTVEKNELLKELADNQIKNIQQHRRLRYKDMGRIAQYIDTSIFDKNNCSIWNGYVTNAKKCKKGIYINFFFQDKKVALHRLLYENFVGPIDDECYLKFSCDNVEHRGKCCNVNHMIKYKYNILNEEEMIVDFTDDNNFINKSKIKKQELKISFD